jgi:chromosome segregation ATPase
MTQFNRLGYARMLEFGETDNPCALADGFTEASEAYEAQLVAMAEEEAKRKADCARYWREHADLKGERRALVGSAPGLDAAQAEWQSEFERRECEAAEETAKFWEEHAAKRAELAYLTGDADVAADAQGVAEMAAGRAEAWKNQCERAEEVAKSAQSLADAVADAPARIDEIDARLAELDLLLLDCE